MTFGKGRGCGDRTVIVCRSQSTCVLKGKNIFHLFMRIIKLFGGVKCSFLISVVLKGSHIIYICSSFLFWRSNSTMLQLRSTNSHYQAKAGLKASESCPEYDRYYRHSVTILTHRWNQQHSSVSRHLRLILQSSQPRYDAADWVQVGQLRVLSYYPQPVKANQMKLF